MSTKRIKELTEALDSTLVLHRDKVARLESELQAEWNKVFDNDKELAQELANAEQASLYQYNESGEIESWYRSKRLEEYTEARAYLENWLADRCAYIDWENSCLLVPQGESLTIQDDARHRRDNGVWLNHEQIIPESDYTDDGGQVDELKRNALIEAYMERTGYFPGVFRVTQHGGVYPVNTTAPK